MGTTTSDRAGDGQSPRRLLRLRPAAGGGTASEGTQRLEQLESELTLLREENARLKVERERPREASLEQQMRDLLPPPDAAADGGADEPWEILIDCMLMRDRLIDACEAIERGARDTRRRLEQLAASHRDLPGPCAGEAIERGDLESVA